MFETYYGAFRTRTFSEVFPTLQDFIDGKVGEMSVPQRLGIALDQGKWSTLYLLLYGRYADSHIASRNEEQFITKLYSTIFMYAPTWIKRLEIQEKLRGISDEDLMLGGKAIYNTALNPGTEPTTTTLEELEYINSQNTTNYKKSKMDAYAQLMAMLETDVTSEFLDKFKKLFLVVVAPDYPLLYETKENEDE